MDRQQNYDEKLQELLISIGKAEYLIRGALGSLYIASESKHDFLPIGTVKFIDDDDDYLFSPDSNIIRTFDRLYDLRKLVIDILNTNEIDLTPDDIFEP